MFGLTQNFSASNVIVNGEDPGINDEEGESDLDVQWSGAVAPGARVDFVTSASTETTPGINLSALYIVDHNLDAVMSESFGGCEKTIGTTFNQFFNSLWEQASAQGITVVISAGDNGSAGCDNFNTAQSAAGGLAVSGFASTPYNVAVGGTDFDQATRLSTYWNTATTSTTTQPIPASAKSYIPEIPWNDTCAEAGNRRMHRGERRWDRSRKRRCQHVVHEALMAGGKRSAGGRASRPAGCVAFRGQRLQRKLLCDLRS